MADLISNEDVLSGGRALAESGVPLQVSNLLDAISQLRAQAAGSTAEIFPSIVGQLGQLRGQYAAQSQALSRRLGYAGGGQTQRAQSALLGQAAGQYGNLITGAQGAAFGNLINTLGSFQPLLSGAARPPNVGLQYRNNPDIPLMGQSLGQISQLASKYFTGNDGGVSSASEAAAAVDALRQQYPTDVASETPPLETIF